MLEKVLGVFIETEDISNVADVANELSVLYERMSDTKNSLRYFRMFVSNKDSLAIADKKNEIERAELKYEFDSEGTGT